MLKAEQVLYDCYKHAIRLIHTHNYPRAEKNINLLRECLQKSIEESKDSERSITIRYLRQWIYHAETELNKALDKE